MIAVASWNDTMPAWAEAQELSEAEGEPPLCPMGNGYGAYLGRLGRLDWWRCAACGLDFHTDAEEA